MQKEENNYAFIDGQNLHLGTTQSSDPWKVDLYKLRVYLERKYKVTKAFYFLGIIIEENNDLYIRLQDAGFIVLFRQHNSQMVGKKKGNIDSDLIFTVMKKLYKNEFFDGVLLVAGDGDYKILVDFLVEEGRFKKILFPNRKRSSSLYKTIDIRFKASLDDIGVQSKICFLG